MQSPSTVRLSAFLILAVMGAFVSGCSLFGDVLDDLETQTLDESATLVTSVIRNNNGRGLRTTVLRSQSEMDWFTSNYAAARALPAVDWNRHSVVGIATACGWDPDAEIDGVRQFQVPGIRKVRTGGIR